MPLYKRITKIGEEKFLDDYSLIGGKGVGLKQMWHLGMPVPEGFILTTKAWQRYATNEIIDSELYLEIRGAVNQLEKKRYLYLGEQKIEPLYYFLLDQVQNTLCQG